MEKEELSKILEDHKSLVETRFSSEKKGCKADLGGADLRDANLDFSCIPLWCGSLRVNMDDRQVKQLLYHTLSIVINSSNVSDDLRQQLLTDENIMIANEFHRVGECPVLTK